MNKQPELRFKDDNGQPFPDWEEKRLGDVLEEHKTRQSDTQGFLNLRHERLTNLVKTCEISVRFHTLVRALFFCPTNSDIKKPLNSRGFFFSTGSA